MTSSHQVASVLSLLAETDMHAHMRLLCLCTERLSCFHWLSHCGWLLSSEIFIYLDSPVLTFPSFSIQPAALTIDEGTGGREAQSPACQSIPGDSHQTQRHWSSYWSTCHTIRIDLAPRVLVWCALSGSSYDHGKAAEL